MASKFRDEDSLAPFLGDISLIGIGPQTAANSFDSGDFSGVRSVGESDLVIDRSFASDRITQPFEVLLRLGCGQLVNIFLAFGQRRVAGVDRIVARDERIGMLGGRADDEFNCAFGNQFDSAIAFGEHRQLALKDGPARVNFADVHCQPCHVVVRGPG